jgi:hypothetical protein
MSAKPTRRSVVSALALGAASTRLDGTLGRAETTIPVAPANETPGTCVLFPQAVEGPFYFDPKLVRSDITEGRPGLPQYLRGTQLTDAKRPGHLQHDLSRLVSGTDTAHPR